MSNAKLAVGTIHDKIPEDLEKALRADAEATAAWQDITPLARNEWICWTISVKQQKTRDDHVRRVVSELKEGIRRPCCWLGCIHRSDKAMSRSQTWVLGRRDKKS